MLLSLFGAVWFWACCRSVSFKFRLWVLPWMLLAPWLVLVLWTILPWLGFEFVAAGHVVVLCVILLVALHGLFVRDWSRSVAFHIPALLATLLVLLIPLMRHEIWKGEIFTAEDSNYFAYLAVMIEPPKDYSEPRVNIPLVEGQRRYTFSFAHKYRGSYEIGLTLCQSEFVSGEMVPKDLFNQIQFRIIRPRGSRVTSSISRSWPVDNTECYIRTGYAYYKVPGLAAPDEEVHFDVEVDFPQAHAKSLRIQVSGVSTL